MLPFENRTGDPEQEYFSDGMTDEMIAQLGRLHPAGLLVIARTSVMRYKKSSAPLDQIARELGVAYVLEGSARREAGRIRISAAAHPGAEPDADLGGHRSSASCPGSWRCRARWRSRWPMPWR